MSKIRAYHPARGVTVDLVVEATLYQGRTRFQRAEVLETRQHGRVLMLDDIIQLGSADEFVYHEGLIHPAMLLHPEPRQIAVVGGGDGGALRELLRHPSVERVMMAELDEQVIELAREWFPEVHAGALDDPRFELVVTDGRAWLEQHPQSFDVVVLDLTDSTGPSRLLYTREFYRIVQRALRPGGVATMQADSPTLAPDAFGSHMRTTGSVFQHVRPYTAYVPSFWALCANALLSDTHDPRELPAGEWGQRLAARGIAQLRYLTPELLGCLWALPHNYQRVIDSSRQLSTDAEPFEIELP